MKGFFFVLALVLFIASLLGLVQHSASVGLAIAGLAIGFDTMGLCLAGWMARVLSGSSSPFDDEDRTAMLLSWIYVFLWLPEFVAFEKELAEAAKKDAARKDAPPDKKYKGTSFPTIPFK